jgi:hypothetical protein
VEGQWVVEADFGKGVQRERAALVSERREILFGPWHILLIASSLGSIRR